MNRSGLCRRFLVQSVAVFVVFRSSLLRPIQLQDRNDADLPDAILGIGLLVVVLPATEFAFDLDVSALRQCGCKFAQLAEDNATVPFGVRYILAALLVLIGGLCRQREGGKAAVVGGANFCVTAEEADEIDFVLVHDFVSVC